MGAQLEPPSPAVFASLSRSAPLICEGLHWASRTACQQHCWRQQPLYEKLNWGGVERIRAAPLERACALPCASPAWSCLDIALLPVCRGPNLASPDGRRIAAETAATGLEALPHMAEIYPLGGEPACLAAPVHPCRKSDPVCLPALEFSHATQLAGRLACSNGRLSCLPAARHLCSCFNCMATSIPPCSQVLGTGWASLAPSQGRASLLQCCPTAAGLSWRASSETCRSVSLAALCVTMPCWLVCSCCLGSCNMLLWLLRLCCYQALPPTATVHGQTACCWLLAWHMASRMEPLHHNFIHPSCRQGSTFSSGCMACSR